jgi:hypothetical protein
LERKREVMKGSREDPLSDAEVMAKLQHCMSFGLRATPADAERVWDVIMNLERHDDAAQAIVSAFPK